MAVGILLGLIIFIATLWADIRGGGATLAKLEGFYLGYSISFGGAILGLIWGFIDGFIFGWVLAYFYNIFTKKD